MATVRSGHEISTRAHPFGKWPLVATAADPLQVATHQDSANRECNDGLVFTEMGSAWSRGWRCLL